MRRLADELTAWQRDADGRPGPGLLPPDRAGRGRPTTAGRAGGWSSPCRRPTSRAWSSTPTRVWGAARVAAGPGPPPRRSTGDAAGRARAGPAGSTPTLDDALRTARAGRARPRRRRGAPVPARGRAAAGRGRVRRAAARLVEPAAGPPGRPAERQLAAPRPGTVADQSALGLNSIVDYEWQIALGDEVLTEAELRTLAELKHAAGPAARAVGRARRQAARGRAEAAHRAAAR